MGKLDPSLVGNVTGRVGEVVFYKRMGQIYVRKYVPKVHDARSEEQLRQRSVFKTMQRLSSQMQGVLQKSMRTAARAEGLLSSNLFLRLNAPCCTVVDGSMEVDYSRLQVAAGSCPMLVPKRAKMTGTRFELRFSRSASPCMMRGDDMVCVFAYCPDLQRGYEALPTMRAAGRMAFVLPDGWKGHEVYFYAYCLNYDLELTSSDSLMVGRFVVGEDGVLDFEQEAEEYGDGSCACYDAAVQPYGGIETSEEQGGVEAAPPPQRE